MGRYLQKPFIWNHVVPVWTGSLFCSNTWRHDTGLHGTARWCSPSTRWDLMTLSHQCCCPITGPLKISSSDPLGLPWALTRTPSLLEPKVCFLPSMNSDLDKSTHLWEIWWPSVVYSGHCTWQSYSAARQANTLAEGATTQTQTNSTTTPHGDTATLSFLTHNTTNERCCCSHFRLKRVHLLNLKWLSVKASSVSTAAATQRSKWVCESVTAVSLPVFLSHKHCASLPPSCQSSSFT